MKLLLASFFCSLVLCISGAEGSDRGFTFDLGQPGQTQVLPSWMAGQPSASPAMHASIDFPIVPPADNSDLAVTFYFNETAGGFLRVYWAGAQAGEMLCENLFEGIGMPNQRTLLIKRSTLSSPGTLTVQSSENTLNLFRVHFEWVQPASVDLSDSSGQTALVDANGTAVASGDVNGAPILPPQDRVQQSSVTAVLIEKPERIETGVEFVATVQAVPLYARMEVQVSGVPIDKRLVLWVNGTMAGEVAIDVPPLTDPGYQNSATGGLPIYVGWRKGVIFLPANLLKVGDNQFQFGEKDVMPAPGASPLAVKNLVIQLNYSNVAPDTQAAPQTSVEPQLQSPASQPQDEVPAVAPEDGPSDVTDANLLLMGHQPAFRYGSGSLRPFDDSKAQP